MLLACPVGPPCRLLGVPHTLMVLHVFLYHEGRAGGGCVANVGGICIMPRRIETNIDIFLLLQAISIDANSIFWA